MTYHYKYIAQQYNSDAYGEGQYNNGASQETSTPTAPGTNPTEGGTGPLANTGYDIILPIALGVAVISASAVLLVKKLRNKQA